MKNIGIISEYNPFHNGHAYQINTIKKSFPNNKLIIVMSGDFVQRGEPSIFNKYLRTTCALKSGADVLFELPPLFATSSAEYFATAAVLSLAKTGIVDTLCFSAETDQMDVFIKIAELLIEEPLAYQTILKENLKSGFSYPKARAKAVASYLQNDFYEAFLKQPNNILGVEYIKTILKYHLAITPYVIKRKGNDYHNLELNHPLSSATALRESIKKNFTISVKSSNFDTLKNYIPESSYQTIIQSQFHMPLYLSDFYNFLQYALWSQRNILSNYFDVTEDIANLLSSYLQFPDQLDLFLNQLSSKNYTNTRIKRILLNILFQNTKEDMCKYKKQDFISYLRLLGFRASSSNILKEMKKTSNIPIINKVADAKKILTPDTYNTFQKDILISQLYKQAYANKYHIAMPSEYEQSVIIEK